MAGLLKDQDMAEFSEQYPSWKITLELLAGNVVTSEVEAVMYVVLSEA
jgi:predicted nuclease of predicted toxin-antitoxin system